MVPLSFQPFEPMLDWFHEPILGSGIPTKKNAKRNGIVREREGEEGKESGLIEKLEFSKNTRKCF